MIEVEAPLDTAPMFVRAGAIIPMGPEMSYVGEKSADPIDSYIYPDETGRAKLLCPRHSVQKRIKKKVDSGPGLM